MMRYQRVSPDCLGPPNGRKPTIRPFSTADSDHFSARSGSGSVTGSATHIQDNYDSLLSENPKSQNNHPGGGGGDVLLQWGHKKRSRGSRTENRTVADDSSLHSKRHIKIQRRAAIASAEKIAGAEKIASASAMPPPCSAGGSGGYPRGANLRACMPLSNNNRSVEDRSNAQQQPDKRSPPSPPPHKASTACANGFGFEASTSMNPDSNRPSDQETAGSGSGGGPTTEKEKVNLEQFEWPRIYISLSRKEKEDDFMAMKGTKLPQRPKKRAKNVDKSLQYCFPGMWLSDLTRGRYEVREKKCTKKKRRGLKGMESMESDSE